MKLAAWARANGVHPQTAYRWFRQGTMPVPARRLPSGTILVEVSGSDNDGGGLDQRAVLYARVSAHDQRGELDRQVTRLSGWATAQGVTVAEVVTEVGSGLNGRRPKLRRGLADPRATMIVVVDPGETSDDLLRDMIEVLTSFCARLYGRRGARNRALRAVTCAKKPPGHAVPSDTDTRGKQR